MPIHFPLESWTGEPSIPGKQAISAIKMEATYKHIFILKNSSSCCFRGLKIEAPLALICERMNQLLSCYLQRHVSVLAIERTKLIRACPVMTTERQAQYFSEKTVCA